MEPIKDRIVQMKHRTVLRAVNRLTFLLGVCVLSVAAEASACPDHAQVYWKTFRSQVLRGAVEQVADATRFPFAINGALDESEKRLIDRAEFIRTLPALLQTDPGLSPVPTTMKSLLQSTTRLSLSFCNASGNQMRVGVWVFALTSEGWRFVQAFVDEQEPIGGGAYAVPKAE